MGAGGLQGHVNGQPFPFQSSGRGAFIDDGDTMLVRLADSRLAFWHRPTGNIEPIDPPEVANEMAGGGGLWIAFAALKPDSKTFGNQIGVRTKAGPGSVAADGTCAWITNYLDGAGVTIWKPADNDGQATETTVPAFAPIELQALPRGRAIWRGGAHGVSVPRPFFPDAMKLKLAEAADGTPWICYWSNNLPGLVLQVDGADEGYILEPRGLAFDHDVLPLGPGVVVVWSKTEGEGPADLVKVYADRTTIRFDVDWEGAARVVPRWQKFGGASSSEPELPTIVRPLWMGFFEFEGGHSTVGNCLLAVRKITDVDAPVVVADETASVVSGNVLGHFVVGATVEEVEERAKRVRFRPVAYWDANRWPRWPNLPAGAWTCVRGYCPKSMTLEAFEQDMRTILASAPAVPIALIGQQYTSNDGLIAFQGVAHAGPRDSSQLKRLAAVYLRLARDFNRVEAILLFSGRGRVGGLEDHPDLIPFWQKVNASVRVPAFAPVEDFMDPWKVTFKSFDPIIQTGKPFVEVVDLGNGVTVKFEKDANDELHTSVFKDGTLQDRSGSPRKVLVGGAAPKPVEPKPVEPKPVEPEPKPAAEGVTLKTHDGHFLRLKLGVVDALAVGEEEAMRVAAERQDDGTVAFRVGDFYLGAKDGGGSALVAVRKVSDGPAGWERFGLVAADSAGFAMQSMSGKFVAAEGGGGREVVVNRDSAGIWETLRPSKPLFAATLKKIKGVTNADGRRWRAQGGSYFPFGASLFWAPWGWQNDRARTQKNLEYAASRHHYTRNLFEVGGSSWSDRVIDPMVAGYVDNLKSLLDAAYGTYGLKTLGTIFGGGTGADPNVVTDKVIEAVLGREEAIQYFEVANEAFQNFTDRDLLRRLARKMRDAFPMLLVATSSPNVFASPADFDLDGPANAFTMHPERQRGDDDWRQGRQLVDAWTNPFAGDANEPGGFESSVEVLTDALRLTVQRLVGITSGCASVVFHCGAGIRGGGAADLARGRKSNLWEYGAAYDDVVQMSERAAALIPQEAPNWRTFKGHWVDTRLFADMIWVDDPNFDHGCVRVYGSYSDAQWVANVFGVKRFVNLTQKAGAYRVKAYDVATGQLAMDRQVANDETFKLDGDPNGTSKAYVIIGTR